MNDVRGPRADAGVVWKQGCVRTNVERRLLACVWRWEAVGVASRVGEVCTMRWYMQVHT